MISWRCVLFGHVIGYIVARGSTLHVQCARCLRLSPGVRVADLAPPRLQPRAGRLQPRGVLRLIRRS